MPIERDDALLIPLADLLGVTVTELLTCQRIDTGASMDTDKVEDIINATSPIRTANRQMPDSITDSGAWHIFSVFFPA